MNIEELDAIIDEYINTFGEEPLVQYPQSPYEEVYINLMKKALKEGKPYTEEDLPNVEEEDAI